MGIADTFKSFLDNLAVDNAEAISGRYRELTRALNLDFRDFDSRSGNNLRVGSYGRWTAIKGVSDLDMLYFVPESLRDEYKNGGQSRLLTRTREAMQARYPSTRMYVDRLVVRVLYTNFHVEVQPVNGGRIPGHCGGVKAGQSARRRPLAKRAFQLAP